MRCNCTFISLILAFVLWYSFKWFLSEVNVANILFFRILFLSSFINHSLVPSFSMLHSLSFPHSPFPSFPYTPSRLPSLDILFHPYPPPSLPFSLFFIPPISLTFLFLSFSPSHLIFPPFSLSHLPSLPSSLLSIFPSLPLLLSLSIFNTLPK